MKHTLLILSTLFCSLYSFAQQQVFGVKSGVNYMTISYSDIPKDGFGYLTSFTGGLSYEHYYKNGLLLKTEFLYNPRGVNSNFIWTDMNGEIIEDARVKIRYNYLSLPAKAGYHFGNKFFGTIGGGVVPSYLINLTNIAENIYDLNGQFIEKFRETSTELNDFNRFDLAGLVEVGVGYKFTSNLWLTFYTSYQHSFTNAVDLNIMNLNNRHRGFSSNLSIKYAWKNVRDDSNMNIRPL